MREKIKRYDIIIKNVAVHQSKVILGMLLLLIQPLVIVSIPILVKDMIDDVIPSGDMHQLIYISMIIGGMFFLGKFIEYIYKSIFYRVNCESVRAIRSDLFSKVMHSDIKEMDRYPIGDIITRIEDDIKNTRVFFIDSIAKMISHILALLISLAMMFNLSIELSVTIILILIAYILISRKYKGAIEKYSKKYIETITRSKSALMDAINHMEVIKINRHNEYVIGIYDATLNEKRNANIQLGMTRIRGTMVISTILNYIPYFILFLGGIMVTQSYLTLGTIIAFTEYSKRSLSSLEHLNSYNLDIGNANVSLDRINEIYNLKKERVKSKSFDEMILVENLSIIKGEKVILNDVSLKIKKNSKIAICGVSGSGKTSLSKIIIGTERPNKGNIKMDHLDQPYFYNGTYIQSMPYVVKGTLKENIVMGQVFRIEKYNNLIKKLKLESVDGKENVSLCSHGEKQKICLARALYMEKEIMVIDEGLSNIDKLDLDQIVDMLLKDENLTVLMITHNLDCIRKYDEVIHIDQGKVRMKNCNLNL